MTALTRDRLFVVLAAVLAPVLAGAIIYCSLRKTRPDLAHLGNWVSFGAFFLLPLAAPGGVIHFGSKTDLVVVVSLGVLVAVIAVRTVKGADAPRMA